MNFPALPTALNLRMIEDIQRERQAPGKQHIATYHTRTGKLALRIEKHTDHKGRVTYNYDGKHGAGSGHGLDHVKSTLRIILETHRGIRLTEGTDLLITA